MTGSAFNPGIVPRFASVLRCDVETGKPIEPEADLTLKRDFELITLHIAKAYDARLVPCEGAGFQLVFDYDDRSAAAAAAVRAGLDIVSQMQPDKIGALYQAQTRVGIASGLVATLKRRTGGGEISGGRAVALAEKLMGLSADNEVVIADNTKRLAATLFENSDPVLSRDPAFEEWLSAWRVEPSATLAPAVKLRVDKIFAGLVAGPRFPGPADFDGAYDPSASPVQNGGQSTYEGSITVTLLSRSTVENVLPAGFTLATRIDNGTQHPVMHLIGHQRDLADVTNGVAVPVPDGPYQEMILLIPFVLHAPGAKWHTFAVKMYLDDYGAIGIGNSMYAYNKAFGDAVESGPADDLTTEVTPLPSGDPCFRGEVAQTGAFVNSDDALKSVPRWSDIRTILDMPIIGIDVDPLFGTVLRTVCSYWELDHTNAEVATATSKHTFIQPFRDGMGGWLGTEFSSAREGSFNVHGIRWRIQLLSIPAPPCQY